jgi:uncharacterized protein (TIGR03435 family)
VKKLSGAIGTRKTSLMRAAGLVAFVVSVAVGLTYAMPSRATAQSRDTEAYPPGFEFDVATIKPSQDNNPGGVLGFLSEDSYRARNMTIKSVIRSAYDLWGGREEMVLGGPKWLETDRYYITAKVDATVADKLKKLRPDERTLTQNQMVRALLADRFKLQIHRETKELPIYALTITKNGVQLKEAKPGDTYPEGFPYADKFSDAVKPGEIFGVVGGGPDGRTMTLYCFGVSMTALARQLTVYSGQIVQDRTGLTGSYDFTLKYGMSSMRPASEGSSDGQSVPAAPDPVGGPDLFAAIQQQLGLKLESQKGPVQVIVIDHIERPSGN